MEEKFSLEFYEGNDISYNLGVVSAVVNPPEKHICKKGDKKFARFFYTMYGKTIFNRDTKDELIAQKGDIVYIPNDIEYFSEWIIGQKGEYISVKFLTADLHFKMPERICTVINDKSGAYLDLFKSAKKVWTAGRPGYKIETLSILYKIIYNLYCEIVNKEIKSTYHSIYDGILYLENHYMEDVTVLQLAQMCNMSEGNFRKHFKKYSDMSPVSYRNYLRMKKACDLLKTGEYNVTEVSNMVNIYDNCYFHKLFKKYFNATPKSFIP